VDSSKASRLVLVEEFLVLVSPRLVEQHSSVTGSMPPLLLLHRLKGLLDGQLFAPSMQKGPRFSLPLQQARRVVRVQRKFPFNCREVGQGAESTGALGQAVAEDVC